MPTPVPADLLAWLTGTWSVDRAINGRAHAFTGAATFTREDPRTLRWDERGRLVLDRYDGPATRTLRILRDSGAGADRHAVVFDDGRPFHALDLSDAAGTCRAEHPCGEDLYRGTYVVESDDALRVVWHVDGPRKADVIETAYRRRPPAPA